ncbi:Putative Zn-dependent protease [Monaibacterium marinum]|uniref:Zn-dependent protease n=1 Tax=Pontivivens marinum TaxID=1690039 RepID=A0A2C9CTZ3_9RHOB|nr:M48 family metalloprotease [Monaibacterium marinum]SOH94794.1 Putative Zn-dependent protease [Monaibacterium marinum]
MLKFIPFLLTGLLGFIGCVPITDQDSFREEHGLILLQNNGLTRDRQLYDYVQQVGQRIIAATPAARDDWQIYVLDTPLVNAFVLDGGAIYVTRGLVMLANNEAEVAAVMAHEIAHLTANHSQERAEHIRNADRDRIDDKHVVDTAAYADGFAAFTRLQEADADRLGLIYLQNAGYAPVAMADFLEAMITHGTIEAQVAGRDYDPTRTGVLASHPASASRLAAVRAALPSAGGGDLGRDAHMDVVDGMIWGTDGRNGFVRNNRWIDPQTGLSFSAPTGLSIDVTALAVRAVGDDGRYLNFLRSRARGFTPSDYLFDLWLPSIGPADFTAAPTDVVNQSINGRQVAYVEMPISSLQGPQLLRLVAVQAGLEMLEFVMIAPQDDTAAMDSLFATIPSIRIIPANQRADLVPTRLRVVTVTQGQTVRDLAAMMRGDDFPLQRFLALNNLAPDAQLVAGQRVKILQ